MSELSALTIASGGQTNNPTPRINLSSLEHIRLEMGRVYREARAGTLPTSEASRLNFMLMNISKALEAEQDKKLNELTEVAVQQSSVLTGINLNELNVKQLEELEMAVVTLDSMRVKSLL
jgi:hypothetical protein